MLKQLVFITILILALTMVSSKKVVMGANGSEEISMTYVETSGDEFMRLRFRMTRGNQLDFDRSAAAICCTEDIITPEEKAAAEAAAAGGGSRNLQEDRPVYNPENNVNKCFGISFTCGIPGGCSGSTQFGVVFYQSTISGQQWQAATNDYSSENVGSVNLGSGTDFSTRYSLDQADAEDSSVPLTGTDYDTKIGCYVGYDIARADVQMNTNIDLSDTSVWTFNDEIQVNVQENELSEENEVSGAFENALSLGALSVLVAFFTIF